MIIRYLTILFLISLTFAGCSSSLIKLSGKFDRSDTYPMFGKNSSRDFYIPGNISDSLNLKWEAETTGSFPQSSVTYFGDYIFINDLSGKIFCFDDRTGKIAGQLKHKGTIYTTPVIYKYNLIYVESKNDEDESYLRVYNFLEGKELSGKTIKGIVKTEMLMDEKEVYFVTEKGLLYKFSHIGDQYWVKELDDWYHSSPASDGKNIFLLSDNGKYSVVDRTTGSIIFTKNTGIKVTGAVAVWKENIFFGDQSGNLYSINKNSADINWEYNSGFTITATPVITDDAVYSVNLRGDVFSVDINSGKEIWSHRTTGLFNSTPAVTGNYLIVPDLANKILFIDKKDGSEKKVLELPNRAKLSPVINKNLLIIGFDRGVIRAYEFI